MTATTTLLGSDMYLVTQRALGGFAMDPSTFYDLLNVARIKRELMRPWKRLRKIDTSQTANAVSVLPTDPTANSKALPSDFLFLSEDGKITLYNQSANIWQECYEVDFSLRVQYLQTTGNFYVDYAGAVYFICGIVDQQYTIHLPYQADLGDISASTTWNNIPGIFHRILPYDVAAMYRLGIDYDDINARNADENAKMADLIFDGMVKWDDNLQRSAITQMDRPVIGQGRGDDFQHRINM